MCLCVCVFNVSKLRLFPLCSSLTAVSEVVNQFPTRSAWFRAVSSAHHFHPRKSTSKQLSWEDRNAPWGKASHLTSPSLESMPRSSAYFCFGRTQVTLSAATISLLLHESSVHCDHPPKLQLPRDFRHNPNPAAVSEWPLKPSSLTLVLHQEGRWDPVQWLGQVANIRIGVEYLHQGRQVVGIDLAWCPKLFAKIPRMHSSPARGFGGTAVPTPTSECSIKWRKSATSSDAHQFS